jgi:DNA alkylation repair enzyme
MKDAMFHGLFPIRSRNIRETTAAWRSLAHRFHAKLHEVGVGISGDQSAGYATGCAGGIFIIHYLGKKAVFLPLNKVLPMLENCLDDERPYVQKAIGWVLREANYVYHAEISAFIEQHLADLRGIAFGAATGRFSAAERGAFIERRKAMRLQSRLVANRLEVGGETV